jgi:glycosyltransferase involved in cell wall biosynthesis
MKIAFVYGAYPPIPDGGAGFLNNLADSLVKLGEEISVITTSKVAAFYNNNPAGPVRMFPVIDDWRISIKNYRQFEGLFRNIQPDIIHTIFPSSSVGSRYQSPMLLKFAARKPLVTTLYGFSIRGGSLGSRLASLTLLHCSDRLTSDNDFVIRILQSYLPYLSNKMRYLPSGSNISNEPLRVFSKASLRSKYGFEPSAFYICHFGYLDMTRNLESLLEAVKIQRDRGIDLRVTMIGGNPFNTGRPRYEQLSNLAQELGLERYITWTGFSDEEQIAHYLMCSDICVLPFRRNTTGRSSLPAALSFGLPVITTSHTKTLFSLRDHDNVILVPPDDVSSLSGAMGELIDDAALRQRLGEAGLKLWREEFSFEVIAKKTLDIYKEIIAKD